MYIYIHIYIYIQIYIYIYIYVYIRKYISFLQATNQRLFLLHTNPGCLAIHRNMVRAARFALVHLGDAQHVTIWGKSKQFDPRSTNMCCVGFSMNGSRCVYKCI